MPKSSPAPKGRKTSAQGKAHRAAALGQRAPKISSPERATQDANPTDLPPGWVKTTLGEICDRVATIQPEADPDAEFTYFDIGGIDNETNRVVETKTVLGREAPSRARQSVRKGDILFSTVRTYLKKLAPIYICGPTASGKSALALEMAEQLDGEIVNADAFQLYRRLEIVSAAPSLDERSRVPHHLYGVLDPAEASDAGSYVRMAVPVIEEIQARGKTPVITGGSGLYLKFLTHGPAPLPGGDAALRADLDARPLADLVAQLELLDPVEAARTALRNRRFVSRALEICLLTGQKASGLRDQWEAKTREISASLRGFVICRTRADLHARIAERTRRMLDGGALEEVAALTKVSANCEKAIGVREIRALLAGEIDRATCEDLINAATRQYAKRQETWFRRERWLECYQPVMG